MKANYLNQAFAPAQVRAIEKYVAAALAANAKPTEAPAPAVVEKKPKLVAAPVVAAKPETTEE